VNDAILMLPICTRVFEKLDQPIVDLSQCVLWKKSLVEQRTRNRRGPAKEGVRYHQSRTAGCDVTRMRAGR
jgi:hypothetical protein